MNKPVGPLAGLVRLLAEAVCDEMEAEAGANGTFQLTDLADVPDAPSNPCTDSSVLATHTSKPSRSMP